jgi:glyoxylase-like metal-dependent hydrolase (beta-lactamase superfamily II)
MAHRYAVDVTTIVDRTFGVNMFLVQAGGTALVDTGTGRDVAETLQILDRLLGSRDLDHILLTHRHVDHVGGAGAIAHAMNAPILASADDGPAIMEADPVTTGARLFRIDLRPVELHLLSHRSVIDLGDSSLEVLHTPGHTLGSVSCYHRESRSLFSGDTVFPFGGVGRWDLPTGGYHELVKSLRYLSTLKVETLYPGHGPVVAEGAANDILLGLRQLEASSVGAP